ncbi:MAG: leader peptidase (prepilin peptidase)/N-methyltransferase [Acidimicrobiales bacterium]|mgnify:CR=1 FL=1|jgi:leader peptidase (prepilin peptidase)/N-methyltransferase
MRKTHQVSSEESEPEQPESNVEAGAASADQPSSVGKNDIAWPVPVVSMYPLAAALSGLMVWAFGLDWVLVSLIPFVIFLSATTVIDLRELRIPDKLTKPAAVAAVPLLALSLLSEWDDISLVRALLGALAMGAFYFTLFFIYPAGMGFGDVKLAPIIGAQLGLFGWVPEVRGLIAAYFIVGPVAVLLLIFGRARMKTEFPFGPFMAIGAIVALVLHARGY